MCTLLTEMFCLMCIMQVLGLNRNKIMASQPLRAPWGRGPVDKVLRDSTQEGVASR